MINGDDGGMLFLDALGGTGKTFLINPILAKLRSEGKIALATASSGIAATLLTGGCTLHSTFKTSLDLHAMDILHIKKGTALTVPLKCNFTHARTCTALPTRVCKHVTRYV